MQVYEGQKTTAYGVNLMSEQEKHRLLQEAIDRLNSAYVRLVQLGNYETFSETRWQVMEMVEKLEKLL